MNASRKWIRIACLVVNLSILSLLFFPISFGTTVSSSSPPESTQDILSGVLSGKQHDGKKDARKGPFESIWKTFRDIVDSTTKNVLSSSVSTSTNPRDPLREDEDPDLDPMQQNRIDSLSNRRLLLMEQSLDEHFSSQFLDSWPILKEYRAKMPEGKRREDGEKESLSVSETEARRARSGYLRWRQPDVRTGDAVCHCFSEGIDAYWSFRWCPESQTVHQGRRQRNGLLQPVHDLGSGRRVPETASDGSEANDRPLVPSAGDDARRLLETARAAHPTAVSFLPFAGGDPCVDGASAIRSSVVVVHGGSSEKCADREGTAMIIESVDEVQVCQYVFHVCDDHGNETANNNNTDTNGTGGRDRKASSGIPEFEADFPTESALKEINETMHFIQRHVTGSYVRKSRADARGRSRDNISASLRSALPPLPQTRIEANRKLIRDMFAHAYDSYVYHGYPAAEVKPITCKPAHFKLVQIPGLTLIDSLDTLVILGNYTEFARAVERLRYLNDNVYEVTGLHTTGSGLFGLNHNVSVFETNIRVLGGLLSGHQLATAFLDGKVLEKDVWAEDRSVLIGGVPSRNEEPDAGGSGSDCGTSASSADSRCNGRTDRHWAYDGFLLELARDIGDRLLPAFDTPTGIPYGTINLVNGIPRGETPIASLAGAGTLSIEMELLGRLTGSSKFGRAAKLATRALWMRRSPLGLLGKHICSHRGLWTETLSGIGSNSDSFYEYLIKHHVLFPEDADFWLQLVDAYRGLHNETRMGEWYGDVDMFRGRSRGPRRVLEALMAFYPGMQVLLGEITPAARTLNSFFLAREYLGFLPERFQYGAWKVDYGGGSHLLRPEILESAYFLHRSSKGFQNQFRPGPNNHTAAVDGSGWLWSGDFALHLIEKLTRTRCGYSSPRDVSPETSGKLKAEKSQVELLDEMPSYFLSETLKYLYLLFDENNILHTDEERDWVFTTEAHPIHHEQKATSVKDKLRKQKEDLKSRMKRRLEKHKRPTTDFGKGLIQDKWTESSKMGDFMAQINPLKFNDKLMYRQRREKEMIISQVPNSFSTSVEKVFRHDSSLSPFDVFSERSQMLNPSYLSFRKLGNQLKLTNSCANLYDSNFFWIRALNGGVADYSDSYKSRTNDDFLASESGMIELGSVDALALHGTGVHIESFYDSFFRCPIGEDKTPKQDKNSDALKNKEKNDELSDGVTDGATRFKMGDDFYDIYAFPGATGFYVQRVGSGETLVTTLIEGEMSAAGSGPLIMVYAKNDKESDTSVSKDNLDPSLTRGDSRSVVVADIHGNSYSCVLQVFETSVNYAESEKTCSSDENGESVCEIDERAIESKSLHKIPCSPGLFGPSRVSHLQKVKTLEVEAKIQASDSDDPYGCGRFSMASPSHDSNKESKLSGSIDPNNHVVSIVHRGDCTFQEKSYNKKTTDLATGVVVINTGMGDELFVMSGGGSEELSNLDSEEYPVTVLVTRDDGEKIMKTLKAREGSDSNLRARISIVHDQIADSTRPNHGAKFWPRVRGSSEGLQIYTKSGWGIHGVQNVVEDESGDGHHAQLTWQLYLLKHEAATDYVP